MKDPKQLGYQTKLNLFCRFALRPLQIYGIYLDSGFSKHMTENISKFSNLVLKSKSYVTYGDKNKRKILGIGKVGAPPFTSIEDILYVEKLKYNLLSINQLCDKGFKIKFTKDECLIEDEANHEVKLIGK